MNTIKRKVNLNKLIFYIAYILMLIYYMGSNIVILSNIKGYIIKFSYILLFIDCITHFTKYKVKSLILIFICIVVSFISWRISGSGDIAILILFITSAKNIEFNNLIKFDIKIKSILLCVVLVAYILGMTDVYYMYRTDGTIRSSMGFSHPNIFATYVFSICCEYVYLNYKNMKLYKVILLIIISFIITYFSDSRTAQFAIIILALIWYINNKFNIFKYKVINKILTIMFIILTGVSYGTGMLYAQGNKIIEITDELLTGRIKCIYYFINKYDINLLGNELELIGTREALEYNTSAKILDNSYIKILLQFGIVNYVLFVLLLYYGIKRAIKEKNYALCLIFLIYFIYGISENALYLIRYNIFLLYFSNIIYLKEIDNYKDLDKGNKEENTNWMAQNQII